MATFGNHVDTQIDTLRWEYVRSYMRLGRKVKGYFRRKPKGRNRWGTL